MKMYHFFWQLDSVFSNFHPAKIEYKGYVFISSEQFMIFSKAKQFKDEITANEILKLNKTHAIAPQFLANQLTSEQIVNDLVYADQWNKLMMHIKHLGRKVKNYDDSVWCKKRFNIVKFGLTLKFSQNPKLKEQLLAVGSKKLVEASPYDKIWGIGLSYEDAKNVPENKWPGLNLLGKVLDEVKEELSALNQIEPTVVSVHHTDMSAKNVLYIGRENKKLNLQKSIFANPFPMKEQSIEERARVIAEFEQWFLKQLANGTITKQDLLSLKGKSLACYCSPKACHGDVIKKWVMLLVSDSLMFDKLISESFC